MTTRTITALYDTRAEAEAAHQRLVEVGVPAASIMVEDASRADTDREHLAALPDEDRHAYEEGIRRGGFLVTVHADGGYDEEAIRVLEETPAFDFEERQNEWRASGWSGYQPTVMQSVPDAPSLVDPAGLSGDMTGPDDSLLTSAAGIPDTNARKRGKKGGPKAAMPAADARAVAATGAAPRTTAGEGAWAADASQALSRATREDRGSRRVRTYAYPALSTPTPSEPEVLPPIVTSGGNQPDRTFVPENRSAAAISNAYEEESAMSGHDVEMLNTLIATTIDSALGFEDAATDAANPQLKSIFSSFASERREVVNRLQAEVRRQGGTAETEGTAKAAAHRRWMDLKNALTSGDNAIVKSVEAGETYIRTKYEAALQDQSLSPSTLSVVTDAYASIARGQARAIELRRCLGVTRSTAPGKVGWGVLGAAAAVAGLGFAASRLIGSRRQETDRDFAHRLETDESMRLISSKKVEGTPVVGRNGERLGMIDSFMVDKYTGRVAYAVMSFGGMMGVGSSLFPLPWSALTYDTDEDGYMLNISKEELAAAPRFEPDDAPEFNTAYRRSIVVFYRPGNSGQYAH